MRAQRKFACRPVMASKRLDVRQLHEYAGVTRLLFQHQLETRRRLLPFLLAGVQLGLPVQFLKLYGWS